MPRARPTAVTVMGILNLVVGGLYLLCVCCSGIALAGLFGLSGNSPELKEYFATLEREVPGFKVVSVAEMFFLLILTIVLIASGIGLLNMQTWARWASVAWAAAIIPLRIASVAYTLLVVNPGVEKAVAKAMQGKPAPGANPMAQQMGALFGTGIVILYALALLVVMFLPDVSAAFSGRRKRRRRTQDDYDEDEEPGYERRPRRQSDWDEE